MSEHTPRELQSTDFSSGVPAEFTQSAFDLYGIFYHTAATRIPELAERSDIIQRSAANLIQRYDIGRECFTSNDRSLVFSAIASRWTRAENNDAEQTFLTDALTLLVHDYSTPLNS